MEGRGFQSWLCRVQLLSFVESGLAVHWYIGWKEFFASLNWIESIGCSLVPWMSTQIEWERQNDILNNTWSNSRVHVPQTYSCWSASTVPVSCLRDVSTCLASHFWRAFVTSALWLCRVWTETKVTKLKSYRQTYFKQHVKTKQLDKQFRQETFLCNMAMHVTRGRIELIREVVL